jgi:hypothetical protein
MIAYPHPPQVMDWLRLAAFLILVLGALLAVAALLFLAQTPDGLPLVLAAA